MKFDLDSNHVRQTVATSNGRHALMVPRPSKCANLWQSWEALDKNSAWSCSIFRICADRHGPPIVLAWPRGPAERPRR
eukprot:5973957-Lingulodinium_polyedra.AAC.1